MDQVLIWSPLLLWVWTVQSQVCSHLVKTGSFTGGDTSYLHALFLQQESAKVNGSSCPTIFLLGLTSWLREALTKGAIFYMKAGVFSSDFTLGAVNLIRKEEEETGSLLLELAWQGSSELILETTLPGKGVPVHVYMWMVWGGTYMTSVLVLYAFWITGFVILISVGPVLFYFLMKREHKGKERC